MTTEFSTALRRAARTLALQSRMSTKKPRGPYKSRNVPKVTANLGGEVSHHIAGWRQFRNLTQEELAEKIGKSKSLISELESSNVNYKRTTLEEIAQALDCTPADLLSRDPSQTAEPWTIWQAATQDQRERILEMMAVITRKEKTG